ncbi:MAG: nitroreductase/quinone reductase family protein [Thermomicrobiales bacterium]
MNDMNAFNKQVIEEYVTNEGNVGGMFEGTPLLLLTTTGAKSGQPRTSPLIYVTDGDRLVIIASKGAATHPDWYHNIVAHPEVTVALGTEKFPARAEIAAEPERTRLFNAVMEVWPPLRQYEQNTKRTMPVIILNRVQGGREAITKGTRASKDTDPQSAHHSIASYQQTHDSKEGISSTHE